MDEESANSFQKSLKTKKNLSGYDRTNIKYSIYHSLNNSNVYVTGSHELNL